MAGVIPCHFGLHRLHVDDIIINHKDSDLGCHGQHSRQSKKGGGIILNAEKVKEISALKSSISSSSTEISLSFFLLLDVSVFFPLPL